VPDALDSTYRRHKQGLYALALSITQDRAAAEDAVHEAFVRLCRTKVQPTGDLTAYVIRAVRNAAIDHQRRAARRGRTDHAAASLFNGRASAADGPDAVGRAEQLDRLKQAVDRLPDAKRQVVVMKAFAGLTYQQMADVTGESINTLAARYRRALTSLRRAMESSHE